MRTGDHHGRTVANQILPDQLREGNKIDAAGAEQIFDLGISPGDGVAHNHPVWLPIKHLLLGKSFKQRDPRRFKHIRHGRIDPRIRTSHFVTRLF